MALKKLTNEDPRVDFAAIFENSLKNSETDANPVVSAMIDTFIEVKLELDDNFADFMEDLENIKDLKHFLMTEYKPLANIEKNELPRIFAEYLLYCLIPEEETNEFIEKQELKTIFEKALCELPSETRAYLMEDRYAFAWGRLLDE